MTETLVDRLRASRNGRAVLKHRLLKLRADVPNALIFAFEGDDDTLVFYQWIRRIDQHLHYIPFPCGGKKFVFQLKSATERDLNDLGRGVFFFVDRDFDDGPVGAIEPNTFVTDMYSIENYIVSEIVLRALLINNFHCHYNMGLIEPIVRKFLSLYDCFLSEMKELNFSLFVARRMRMDCRPAPKLSMICEPRLNDIFFKPHAPRDILEINCDQFDTQVASLRQEFETLDARARYRGKYALDFFLRWLDALATDHETTISEYFPNKGHRSAVRRQELLSLSHLASLSPLPDQLEHFVRVISIANQFDPPDLSPECTSPDIEVR